MARRTTAAVAPMTAAEHRAGLEGVAFEEAARDGSVVPAAREAAHRHTAVAHRALVAAAHPTAVPHHRCGATGSQTDPAGEANSSAHL